MAGEPDEVSIVNIRIAISISAVTANRLSD